VFGVEVGVGVGVPVGVAVPLGVGVGVGVFVDVGVGVVVGVGPGVPVPVGVIVGVAVGLDVGVELGVEVGVPVGVELGKYYLKDASSFSNPRSAIPYPQSADGSIIIVIATDAPLDHRQLRRLAERSMAGLARTGSSMTNGSGDYAIAFSTKNRINAADQSRNTQVVGNDAMSPLFQAVIETTEEAIINSLLMAATVTGKDKHTVEALPVEKVTDILRKYRKID